MKGEHIQPAAVALFTGAALAFALGQYAVGVWLALGCVAAFAWLGTAHMRADRPDTVAALQALASRLDTVDNRLQFLVIQAGTASPQGPSARGPSSATKSGVRPPAGWVPKRPSE